MVDIIKIEETDYTLKDVYELTQSVYQERVNQGMAFWATQVNLDKYIQEFKRNNAIVFVAIKPDTEELCGVTVMYVKKTLMGNYAHFTNSIVVPMYQNKGIGSLLRRNLEKIAFNEYKCQYVISTTGTNATSSITWHKKNGYKIVGRNFWLGYYSYIFRKQLLSPSIWNNDIFCHIAYIISNIKLAIKLRLKIMIRKK